MHWRRGPQIYGVSKDTPLETELVFSPSGKRMLALVRLDGDDSELLGGNDHLRTKVCWATPALQALLLPADAERCAARRPGGVLLGRAPVRGRAQAPLRGGRCASAPRSTSYAGTSRAVRCAIHEWGELPSAGDTSYAGIAPLGGSRFLVTWYSSPPAQDQSWLDGFRARPTSGAPRSTCRSWARASRARRRRRAPLRCRWPPARRCASSACGRPARRTPRPRRGRTRGSRRSR